MKFLSSKSGSCLGLDIGSSAIKCVELSGSWGSPKVKIWGIEPIPPGSIESGAIVNQDKVIEALNSLITRCRIKTKNVSIAISSSHAITKTVQMSSDLTERDLEDMVESEASHFVPYAIDDVNLDFQVLGPTAGSNDEQDVFIAACRTDIIDDYVSILEEVELSPKIVDIDTHAIERLYLLEQEVKLSKEPIAIFDVGVNSTKLSIIEGQKIIFNRQQKFGGDQLSAMVRQEYGLSAEEASAVIESESPPADIREKVYKPYCEQAATEFSRALKFFYSSSKYKNISKVLFTGGVSNLDKFSSEVGTRMNVNADSLCKYSKFSISGNRATLSRKEGSLSVATGLALRGLTG